jgi:hypothetical protein
MRAVADYSGPGGQVTGFATYQELSQLGKL